MTVAVPLNYQVFGESQIEQTPLVILHGLLGAGRNWFRLARQFSSKRQVIVPDLRCHGSSDCGDTLDYDAYVADLIALFDDLGISQLDLLGHSMGGKTAMHMALQFPDRIKRQVIADIAPVKYPDRHQSIINQLLALPLEHFSSRNEVDQALAADITEPLMRQFLLQNLANDAGRFYWRVDFKKILNALPKISDFPDYSLPVNCQIPSLFLDAEQSDYILPTHVSVIHQFFSDARITSIPQAGHWLHVDQPDLFFSVVDHFLQPE